MFGAYEIERRPIGATRARSKARDTSRYAAQRDSVGQILFDNHGFPRMSPPRMALPTQ